MILRLVAVLLLSGCALTPQKVVTEVKTVEISVPVRTPCLKPEEIPAKPSPVMDPKSDVRGLAAGAVAELRAWENYHAKVDALLKGCL